MLEMFEKFFVPVMLFLAVQVLAALLISLSAEGGTGASVQSHDMGNGIVCYTYDNAIDCIQVER